MLFYFIKFFRNFLCSFSTFYSLVTLSALLMVVNINLFCVAGALNNEDNRPGYMRATTAAHRRDRHGAAVTPSDSEEVNSTTSGGKRRSMSLKELDGGVPSYMKPTNRSVCLD